MRNYLFINLFYTKCATGQIGKKRSIVDYRKRRNAQGSNAVVGCIQWTRLRAGLNYTLCHCTFLSSAVFNMFHVTVQLNNSIAISREPDGITS